ncbi:MAG: hypothetical protein ABUL62_32385 [Myxococcales bacterium]
MSYAAPDECPSFAQFLSEVQLSSARVRLAGPGEAARRFEVKIAENGLTGQLTLGGGQGGERAASGENCRAVAALLAFAVALAADPEAQPAEPTRGVAAFPALRPAPPATVEPTPTPAPVVPPPRAPVPVPHSAAPSPRLEWGVADVGFVTGASAPPPTWGGGAVAELQLSAVSWAPRFRLGANYAKKTLEQNPGQVALTMAFLSFEFCSGALHRGGFTFLPCLRVQGGTRNAEGIDLPNHRSEQRGFLELGAAGHVRFRFAGPAFIELGAALLFPTVRDWVKIQPNIVYEVPTVGVLGECALGVELGDQTAN